MSKEDRLRVELDSVASKDGIVDLLESTTETMKKTAQGKKFRIVLIIRERETAGRVQ
jgi:hypothetical protein